MDDPQTIYEASRDGHLHRLQMYPRLVVRKLLCQRRRGMTPLTIACVNGHVDVVEYLLDRCGANIEQCGYVNEIELTVDGAPPLWWATHRRHSYVVRSLLTRGADVNGNRYFVPLVEACVQGDLQIVKYLVANGANVNYAAPLNRVSALDRACRRGHYQIACYLIRKGADLLGPGAIVLRNCVESLNWKLTKLLLRYGAGADDVLSRWTPLLLTRSLDHQPTVEYSLCLPFVQRYPLPFLRSMGVSWMDINLRKRFTVPNERRTVERDQVNGHRVLIEPLNIGDEQRINVLRVTKPLDGHLVSSSCFYSLSNGHTQEYTSEPNRMSKWEVVVAMLRLSSWPVDRLTRVNICLLSKLFVDMVSFERPVAYQLVVAVLFVAVREMDRDTVVRLPFVALNSNRMKVCLAVSVDLTFCVVHLRSNMSEQHIGQFDQLVSDLVGLDGRGFNGWTPLHIVCRRLPTVLGPYESETIRSVVELLLSVGADPQAVDDDENGPLHHVAMLRPVKHDVIGLLLSRGAHFDARNAHGRRFTNLLTLGHRLRYL